MCSFCLRSPCAAGCPNASCEQSEVCCYCGEEIYPSYELYSIDGMHYDSRECIYKDIANMAELDDLVEYCRQYKNDFYDFIDLDNKLLGGDKVSIIVGPQEFSNFALWDIYQFGDFYMKLHALDIVYGGNC